MSRPHFDLTELARQRDRVERLARALVGDSHDAEDLAQESWLRLLETGGPDEHAARVPWMRTTVQRLGWNHWRSAARRSAREQDAAQPEAVPSSAEIAERADVCRRVGEAIDALPPLYATALRDHYFGELSHEDVARRDGISPNTVKSRVTRGRALLRDRLERLGLGGSAHWLAALAPLLRWRDGTSRSTTTAPASAASGPSAGSDPTPSRAPGRDAAGSTAGPGAAAPALGVVAALGLALGALWWAGRPSGPPGDPRPQSSLTVADAGPAPRGDSTGNAAPEGPDGSREALAPGPVPRAEGAGHEWTGRVVDAEGRPLAGTTVRIATASPWAARDVGATVFSDPYYGAGPAHEGFETTTGPDGRFRLRAPATGKASARLSLLPDPFHRRRDRLLGDRATDRLPAPQPGSLDLGTFALAPAGALSGRVVEEGGAPVPFAVVEARGARGQRTASTSCDAHGRFLLAHVPMGEAAVVARAPGRLESAPRTVGVTRGVRGDAADLVLSPAPRLVGEVVDPMGRPLSGLVVHGMPPGGGRADRSRTGPDGRFAMELCARGPHRILVLAPGFAPVDRSVTAADGDEVRPLRIALEPAPRVRFRVVDDATGGSVSAFAAAVLPPDAPALRATNVADTDGTFSRNARPGVDRVHVRAEGYLPLLLPVALEEADEPTMTLRLGRGSRLRGRIVSGGRPRPGALVEARAGSFEPLVSAAVTDGGSTLQVFVPEEGPSVAVTTDDEGAFELTGLAAGPHRVAYRTADGPRGHLRPVELDADGTRDLGAVDIALLPPGDVEGRVVLPAGVPHRGVVVHLDGWPDCGPVDSSGRFSFRGVPAGVHGISWSAHPGLLAEGGGLGVEVRAGSMVAVELDARPFALARLDVLVVRGEEGVAGAEVYLLHGGTDDPARLGATDRGGRLEAQIRVRPPMELRVVDPVTNAPVTSPLDAGIAAGAKVHVRVPLGDLSGTR